MRPELLEDMQSFVEQLRELQRVPDAAADECLQYIKYMDQKQWGVDGQWPQQFHWHLGGRGLLMEVGRPKHEKEERKRGESKEMKEDVDDAMNANEGKEEKKVVPRSALHHGRHRRVLFDDGDVVVSEGHFCIVNPEEDQMLNQHDNLVRFWVAQIIVRHRVVCE